MKKYHKPNRPCHIIPPIAATRERLALAVIILFAAIILAALFFPDVQALQQVVPFVGGLLAMIISFYFHRRRQE